MLVRLPLIALAYATVAWALCLAVAGWVASVWLDRPLSVGEWLGAGVVLALPVALFAKSRHQRRRRAIEDMRDSALW